MAMLRRRRVKRGLSLREKEALRKNISELQKYGVKVVETMKYRAIESKADVAITGMYRAYPVKKGEFAPFFRAKPEERREMLKKAKEMLKILEKSININPSRIEYQRKMLEELERLIEE